jgi:hypothetical protein
MKIYKNTVLGFSIGYPESWQAVPAPWMKQNSGRASSTSAELAKILNQARAPFLFIQNSGVASGLAIPSVKCQAYSPAAIASAGDMSGLMSSVQQNLKEAFHDYELLEYQPEYLVAGVVGARLLTAMSVKNPEGESFHAASELLCMPTAQCCFLVGLSATSIEAYRPVSEFMEIIRSIRLQ